MHRPGFATLVLVAGLLPAAGAQAANFTYTELSVPGAVNTSTSGLPGALNDSDQVVGSATVKGAPAIGFVWQGGTFALHPEARALSAIDNAGHAVGLPRTGTGYLSLDTNTGRIVVYRDGFRGTPEAISQGVAVAQSSRDGNPVGYILNHGAQTIVAVPGANATSPTAINLSGAVTGGFYAKSALGGGGFVYQNGTYTRFFVPYSANTNPVFITADGVIGGSFTSTVADAPLGFILRDGNVYIYVPGDAFSDGVTGIGPGGEVVGSYEDMHIKGHGWIFRDHTFYQINFPGAADTAINGVNARGSLVGSFMAADGSLHAFVARCPAGEVCTQ